MGRRKVSMGLIPNRRVRTSTFGKRKEGLKKKANELSVLCGVEVALVVAPADGEGAAGAATAKADVWESKEGVLARYRELDPEARARHTFRDYLFAELGKEEAKLARVRQAGPTASTAGTRRWTASTPWRRRRSCSTPSTPPYRPPTTGGGRWACRSTTTRTAAPGLCSRGSLRSTLRTSTTTMATCCTRSAATVTPTTRPWTCGATTASTRAAPPTCSMASSNSTAATSSPWRATTCRWCRTCTTMAASPRTPTSTRRAMVAQCSTATSSRAHAPAPATSACLLATRCSRWSAVALPSPIWPCRAPTSHATPWCQCQCWSTPQPTLASTTWTRRRHRVSTTAAVARPSQWTPEATSSTHHQRSPSP